MSEFVYLTFTLPPGSNLVTGDQGPKLLLSLAEAVGGQFIRPRFLPRTDPAAATANLPAANTLAALTRFWADAMAAPLGGEDTYFAMRFKGEPHFYVDFHVDVIDPVHLFLLVSANFFKRPGEADARYHRLLQAAGVIYRELRPVYGFGWVPWEAAPLGWRPSLTAPDTLYDCNFFGPAVVEKLERAALLGLPAARTVEFPDGGVLVVMREAPFTGELTPDQDERAAAARLGLAAAPGVNAAPERAPDRPAA